MRAHATEEWDIFMAMTALTIKQRVAENAANSFHLTNLYPIEWYKLLRRQLADVKAFRH
jgi:hypothetical protein